MNIFKSKFFLIILFFLVFVGLILGFKYFLIVSSPRNSLTSFDAPINESVKNAENIENQECITKTEEHIVRGDSLSGIIEPGQTIRVLVNYYNCNKLKNGDIVIYNYAGSVGRLI